MHYLGRFFYDTALSANPRALRSLLEPVGPSQILFGSDYPFAPAPLAKLGVQELASLDGLDARERRGVERDNALHLLPRLRASLERV